MKKLSVVLNVIFSVVCAIYLTGCCGGFINEDVKALQGFAQVQKVNYSGSTFKTGVDDEKKFMYLASVKVFEIDKNGQEKNIYAPRIMILENTPALMTFNDKVGKNSAGTAKNMVNGNSLWFGHNIKVKTELFHGHLVLAHF